MLSTLRQNPYSTPNYTSNPLKLRIAVRWKNLTSAKCVRTNRESGCAFPGKAQPLQCMYRAMSQPSTRSGMKVTICGKRASRMTNRIMMNRKGKVTRAI